ncbi:cell division protein FtsL [Kordiimonas sp.]|uniref:cell division protein FtsL n=1 Tax=Kordiimonas sp. TaxID=1970157 RepID=UPI003A901E38
MRRLFTILAAFTAILAGAAVLQLKLAVQEKADEVRALANIIHEDREAIRVLEAEWAFLTTPRSLQEKSIRFLALMPPTAEQILEEPTRIPFRPRGVEAEEDPGVLLPASEREGVGQKPEKERGTSL